MSDQPLYLVRFPATAEREVLVYANTADQARKLALGEIDATCERARQRDIVRLVAAGVIPIDKTSAGVVHDTEISDALTATTKITTNANGEIIAIENEDLPF